MSADSGAGAREGRHAGGELGFGMIELLVGIALSVGVLTVAGGFFTSAWTHTASLEHEMVLQDGARRVLQQIDDELRQAYTGQAGLSPVASLSSTSITFYSPNRDTPFRLRKITYQHSGTTLTRSEVLSDNTAAPWSFPGGVPTPITVLTDVLPPGGSPAIAAIFTGAGSPIRTVTVQVSIDTDPTRSPSAQKYETAAHIRVTPT
ncbi:MAG: hypothetical protein WA797_03455 [Acidimicrobiales bacterium]